MNSWNHIIVRKSIIIIGIIIIFSLLRVFYTSFSLEFEWQQVSTTFLNVLADLNNTVVWMVPTRPLISKFSIHGKQFSY